MDLLKGEAVCYWIQLRIHFYLLVHWFLVNGWIQKDQSKRRSSCKWKVRDKHSSKSSSSSGFAHRWENINTIGYTNIFFQLNLFVDEQSILNFSFPSWNILTNNSHPQYDFCPKIHSNAIKFVYLFNDRSWFWHRFLWKQTRKISEIIASGIQVRWPKRRLFNVILIFVLSHCKILVLSNVLIETNEENGYNTIFVQD